MASNGLFPKCLYNGLILISSIAIPTITTDPLIKNDRTFFVI